MKELIKYRSEEEDDYTAESYRYTFDGVEIGSASVMVSATGAYIERIDINESYRNQGHGTDFLRGLSEIYSSVYLAPDNEDAQRLYERIGSTYYGDDAAYVDQGYGVYEI